MNIIALIVIAIIFRMCFDIFVSKAGGRINDLLANGIFSGLAAVLPLLIYMAMKSTHTGAATTKAGIIYSILAGISVAIFSVVLIRIFEQGGHLSFVMPAIYGGTIIGVSLVGWLVFKEPVTLMGILGVVVIGVGVGMVAAAKS